MKKNVGMTDRIIRLLIFVIIGLLYFADLISGTLALVLGAVALIALVTSLFGVCGLYTVFGWSTCKIKKTDT